MIKMKDLVLEGRDIQSKFKKNVMKESNSINEEDGMIRKIARYITGAETLVIMFRTVSPADPRKSPSDDDAQIIGQRICDRILVKKYGMEQVGGGELGGMAAYQIELDSGNKNKFSDSTVKRIVDECIQKISTSNPPKTVKFIFTADLYKRNKFEKQVYKSERGGIEQTKMDLGFDDNDGRFY
jgi:hypothetical protein